MVTEHGDTEATALDTLASNFGETRFAVSAKIADMVISAMCRFAPRCDIADAAVSLVWALRGIAFWIRLALHVVCVFARQQQGLASAIIKVNPDTFERADVCKAERAALTEFKPLIDRVLGR